MSTHEFEAYKSIVINALEIDDETLQMLIDTFFESTKEDLATLSSHVANRDFSGISSKSHAIKGAASSMRFDLLAALLKQLELTAKDGDEASSDRVFAQIMLEFDALALMCGCI
jgi:HPt (histidine-containing phosphotransfer) domain-containing protein